MFFWGLKKVHIMNDSTSVHKRAELFSSNCFRLKCHQGLPAQKERFNIVICNFFVSLLALNFSRRERHAKTLDIAQEEVLTCLGIYLYERMHKIWQKLRAEEQTWQILFYLGVDSLRKSFEVSTVSGSIEHLSNLLYI